VDSLGVGVVTGEADDVGDASGVGELEDVGDAVDVGDGSSVDVSTQAVSTTPMRIRLMR